MIPKHRNKGQRVAELLLLLKDANLETCTWCGVLSDTKYMQPYRTSASKRDWSGGLVCARCYQEHYED